MVMTSALVLVGVRRDTLDGETPVLVAAAVVPVLADLRARARVAGAPVAHVRNDGGEGVAVVPAGGIAFAG